MHPRNNVRPRFLSRQLELAEHIRNPQAVTPDMESRRLQLYVDLVYENIESFLASTFPVTKSLLAGERWSDLVRQFIREHPCTTPFFLEISREFLEFIAARTSENLPPFMVELCHYEWIELDLAVAQGDEAQDVDPDGDPLSGMPVVTPFLRTLAYRYPVHRIGPAFQPAAPPGQATELVAYRRPDYRVGFMQVNQLAMSLLDTLNGHTSGANAIDRIVANLPRLDPVQLRVSGRAALQSFRNAGIVLGTRCTTCPVDATAKERE